MQEIYYQEIDQNLLTMKEIYYGITPVLKTYHHYTFFEDKQCNKRNSIFYKNKVHFVDSLSRRTCFWDKTVPCGSENSHNVVQLNPDEDKYYFLTPYPTLMQPLKKFSLENIRAIARNPNIDLQSIGIYSRHSTPHSYTAISRTPHKNEHNTTTTHRPKFLKTCRNCRTTRHLYKRL